MIRSPSQQSMRRPRGATGHYVSHRTGLSTVFRSLLGADNELLAVTAAAEDGACTQLSCAIDTGERAMGPTACGLVAGLIDWIEGPPSDQGRPRCPTEAVVETLRFFLREGVQWRELRAAGDRWPCCAGCMPRSCGW